MKDKKKLGRLQRFLEKKLGLGIFCERFFKTDHVRKYEDESFNEKDF